MCLNRVETADSVTIVQPFSPCLFQQNDLPGPNLFLKFWRGQLTPKECVTKWLEENKQKKKSRAVDWPKKMPLFCRGCSDAIDKDIQNSLDEFPRTKKSNIFETLIAEGMERFCNACRRSGRLKNLPDNAPDDHNTGSEEDNIDTEEKPFVQCQQCKGLLHPASFDAEKLQRWTKNRLLSNRAICLHCEAKKDEHRDKIKCVRCKEVKSRNEYDPIMLHRWTINRNLAKSAECKNCAAARGAKTHEPKRIWKESTYRCSKCKVEYPPNNFAYSTLASLEADGQSFLAVCLHCNPVIHEKRASLKPVTCVACKKLKERKEFSLERQRHRTLATRYELIHARRYWQLTSKYFE